MCVHMYSTAIDLYFICFAFSSGKRSVGWMRTSSPFARIRCAK